MDGLRKQVPAAAMRCVVGTFELGDNGEGAKTAPFRMVARTGDSIDHWYWGRVVHDLSGMRRHKAKLPIDYAHDDKEVIGYANFFDASSGDLEVGGTLVPYKDTDRASEVIYKAKQGVPYEASINFGGDGIVLEEFAAGQQVEVNGRQFSGPVTVIRQWPLRGIAVCPYGADANTSTALSAEHTQEVTVVKHDPTKLNAESQPEATEAEVAAVEVAEVNDTPAEAAESATVEAVQPTPEATPEPAALKRTGQEYLDRFGDQGGVWFAQGKEWDDCVLLHERSLRDRIENLEAKLSAYESQLGESEPVTFEAPQEDKPVRRGIENKIRIRGRNYD